MTVRLRGHHLLCLLTYRGEGYSPAFVANLDRLAARLADGEAAELVDEPDDICAPLLRADGGGAGGHCTLDRVRMRDRRALVAAALLGRELDAGDHLTLDAAAVGQLRAAFAAGGPIRSACAGCEWNAFCTAVAITPPRFAGVRLLREAG
jgi:uncharacterized protein